MSDVLEQFVDVLASLCRGLEELQSVLVCELLASLGVDDFVFFVGLVADEHLRYVLRCVLLDLLHPVGDVRERLFFGAVVDQNDAHGALVVRLRNRSESFLSGCVPDLQLDHLSVDVDRLDFEVDAYTQSKPNKRGCAVSGWRRHKVRRPQLPPAAAGPSGSSPTICGSVLLEKQFGWILTDCGHVRGWKVVFGKSEQDACLADA